MVINWKQSRSVRGTRAENFPRAAVLGCSFSCFSLVMHAGDCVLLILGILIPPLAVLLKVGCNCQLLLNFILWCLCVIPGSLFDLCELSLIVFRYSSCVVGDTFSSRARSFHCYHK